MGKTIGVTLNLKDMFSPSIKSAMQAGKQFSSQMKSNTGLLNTMGKVDALKPITNSFQKVNKEFGFFHKKIAESVSLAKKAAIGMGVAIMGAGAKMGFSEAFNLEGYRSQLITATNSTEKASELMQNAVKLANATPFEAGPLIDATQRLEMMGISSQKWLNTIADTSGALGKDVIQVTEAIIDANVGEFERLKELGIRKDQILLESNKKYGEGVVLNAQGQVQDQAKLMDVLQGMMDSKFKGGAEKLAGTTKGLWSTITGITKTSLANIIGIQNDGVIKQGSLLDFVKGKVQAVGDKLQELQNNGALEQFSEMFTEKFKQITTSIGNFFKFVGEHQEFISFALKTALALLGLVKTILLVNKTMEFAGTTMNVVKTIIANWQVAAVIGVIIALVAAGVYLYTNWDKIKQKAIDLWNWLTSIWNNLGTGWKVLVFGMVNVLTGGIAFFIALGVMLYTHWDEIKAKAIQIWSSIPGFFEWIGNSISSFFEWVGNSISSFFEWAWNGVSSFFAWLIGSIPKLLIGILTWIKTLPSKIAYILGYIVGTFIKWGIRISLWVAVEIPKIVNAIVNWFKELPNRIWAWLLATWEKLKEWAINLTIWVNTSILEIVNAIVNWFATLPGRIWAWLVETWNRFLEWGANLIAWAGTAMSELIEAIINWFVTLPGRIWDWLVECWNKFLEWGANLIQWAGEWGSQFVEDLLSWFKSLPGKFYDIGANIIKGIWEGIKSSAGWLKDKATELLGDFTQGIKDGLGIHSPSRVFADEVGRWIPAGIQLGFETEFPNMEKAIGMKTRGMAEDTRISDKSLGKIGKSANVGAKEQKIYVTNHFTVQGNLVGNEDFMEQTGQYIWDTIEKNLNNI